MLAAVAAGFASCSIREMAAPEAPVNGIDVTVNASMGETKTVFGDPSNGVIPVTWAAEGEVVELIEFIDGAASQAVKSTGCTVENNGMNAKFQFTLAEKTGTEFQYYGVYPASAYRTASEESLFDYAWAVDPQHPTLQGPDPAYCILMSKLPAQSAQQAELNMAFEHVTTYVKFSLKNTPFAEGEELELINVEVPGKDLAGRYRHYADSVTVYGTTNTPLVAISPDNLDTKSGSFDVWMACKPFALKAGEKAYVKLKTPKRVITKEITAPADMDFSAGSAFVLGLDMTTADAPRILEPNLTLSFDFSTAKATLPSWPTAKGKTVEAVYPLDGTDYTFEIKDTYAAASQLTSEVGGYVRIPVIPGATIVSINGVTVKAKNSYACSITEDPEGTKVVTGGEKVVWTTAGDHIYVLSGTKAETPYYIYANGPLPINKIVLNYYVEGETPAGPQPYEYPEVKNTIVPIVNAFWAETYGGSTTKAVKGATNFDVIESGIQFKADEHGLAVPGATVTSPGVTSFDICSNAQTKMYDIYGIIKGNTFDNPHPIYFYTPVDQKIYGDLEFCLSIETGKQIINDVKLEWSSTGNDGDWKPFDNVYSKAQNTPELAAGKTNYDPSGSKQIYDGWAVCEFSIPEAEAIPAGGGFYVKATIGMKSTATDATATTRVNGGFILKNRTVNTEFTGANVLASRNFSDMTRGFDTMLGKPIYYLQFYGCGTAEPVANEVDAFGWTPVGAFQVRRGYVWANSAGTDGALAYYMSPALTALTEPTDIVVTFRAAAYVPATGTGFDEHMGVAVEGPGSVSDVIFDEPCVPEGADWLNPELYKWHRGYAVIKGATAETKVKVGLLEENVGTPRFLLDDIVITK